MKNSTRPSLTVCPSAHKVRRTAAGFATLMALFVGCGEVGKGPETDTPDLGAAADLGATLSCSPKNCAGCCSNGVCQPGNTRTYCGTAGGVCGVCSASQSCGADSFCSYDPAGSFLFAVVQAELSTTNPTTSMPWRSNGMAPQPLVQFDTANRTNVVTPTSSTNPPGWLAVWREGFFYKAKDLLSTGVKLQVFDRTAVTPLMLTPMSSPHSITLTQKDLDAGSVEYVGWEGVKKILLVLERQ